MIPALSNQLTQYLTDDLIANWENNILVYPIARMTPGIEANSVYFGHPVWGKTYLDACHRDPAFIDRWHNVIGNWEDKIVVDIGCGPGNLFASLQDQCGTPKL